MVTPAGGAEIELGAERLDFLTVCDRLPYSIPALGGARRLLRLGSGTRGELVPPWTL